MYEILKGKKIEAIETERRIVVLSRLGVQRVGEMGGVDQRI